jgi:hypothetical protein
MRPDLLLWLAESHRNFHVARPGLSQSLAQELWSQEPWTQGIAYEDFPLLYEPRSLARSPDGKKIVVGTKAGFLLLASWDGARWRKHEWQLDREFKGKGETISRSIRAVRFLDDTIIVAGWGEGGFGVFDTDSLDFRHLVPSEAASRSENVNGGEHQWLGRFARFIALVPPSHSLTVRSAVMLGVTLGSQVHVLYRDGEKYSAKTYLPEDIFPSWGEGARVVDGVWSHNYLWVLDSSGRIYRYVPADPQESELQIPLKLSSNVVVERRRGSNARSTEGIFHLEHPREIGEFRALAACVMGLAVLTSDDITFLRFNMPKDGADLPSIIPTGARWVAVPKAIDCSICLPFCSYYEDQPLASQTITSKNPVWTVVGSSHSGVRWISWHDPVSNSSGRLPAVSHAHPAGSGNSSVLQIRFGFFGHGGPTYIACATRDHRLRIATILDRMETEKLLSREIPKALEENPALDQESGISWWLALERIENDFNPAAVNNFGVRREPRSLLRFTEREDLYRLIRRALRCWSTSPLDAVTKKELIRDWVYHILARAYQIEETLAQDLARLTHDRIAQMRGRRGEEGRKVEVDLGLFAAFLRKWVVYGHTYGEKTSGLFQLYDWNRSGHVLDALTYLTKLLRRRVDLLWEARPASGAPGLAVWDVVAPPSGVFSIYCGADGRITAVARTGEILPWEFAGPDSKALKTHCIEIYQGQLRHRAAEKFIEKYRHGPYARELFLSQISGEDESSSYLLIFCLRGWRREGQAEVQDQLKARLYALLVQPTQVGLSILAIDSHPLPTELYGLCELQSLKKEGRHVLVAGTKGVWRSEDRWRARPFIEFCVEIGKDGYVRLDLDQHIEVAVETRGERSVFKSHSREDLLPEAAHNPCWSLCTLTTPAGELWLWAGFHDGHIRCFRRSEDVQGNVVWIEGGELHEGNQGRGPRVDTFKSGLTTSAPVWRLHIIKEQQVLAYGSADGIIGIVPLSEDQPYGEQASHLAHHRESSPICGLASYVDPEGGTRLLATTQGGVVVIFDLEIADHPPLAGPRFAFPGLPLDRFALPQGVRAIAVVEHDAMPHSPLLGGRLPALLAGSNEGSVLKYVLALPRGTGRRKIAYNNWCHELLEHRELQSADGTRQPPPLEQFVGDNISGWLRVLDVRDVQLLRYSISRELRARWPLDSVFTLADPDQLRILLAQLNSLADEIYGRRPLTPEPAKVIWEEAARISNKLAWLALESGEEKERNALLFAFLELNKTVDDLCNRWIGSEQAIESRVLMHIFNCLFDWVGIILIGLASSSEAVLSVRRFLLHNLIQRRLNFNDRIVYLEALRNLNVALMRSVRNLGAAVAGGPRWELSLWPEAVGQLGLYDLLTMVGDLGEQHAGSLTPADPLWTELSRFFAASLLLLPHRSFVISQVIAESRLTERDTFFARAVQDQAAVILAQLGMASTEEIECALRQFRDSFDDKIGPRLTRSPSVEKETGSHVFSEAWTRLLEEADEAEKLAPSGGYSDFSNESFLFDHTAAIRTAAYLIWLTNEEPLPDREQVWLSKSSRYFEHSRIYLNRLLETWRQVRSRVGLGILSKGAEPPGKASISSALQLCDQEQAYLDSNADLFEPQRTQYVRVIGQWREQIWKRGEDAIGLLDVLDKFNRHTYRASSDRLMSSITELALQTAPLWSSLGGKTPKSLLRSEIEQRLAAHPLVRTIFDSGNRLVASTHLAGTLFVVARDYYRASSAPAPYQASLKEIRAELETFCQYEGLELDNGGGIFDEKTFAPGTLAVWDTVLQEIVTNARKYCREVDRRFLAACEQAQDRVKIAFAARRPFIDCLAIEHRKYIEDSLTPAERFSRLLELVSRTKESGQRLAPVEGVDEGSSGMGLTLILRICGYLGMEADIVLRDLEVTARRRVEDIANEDKIHWPLCLEISWKGR